MRYKSGRRDRIRDFSVLQSHQKQDQSKMGWLERKKKKHTFTGSTVDVRPSGRLIITSSFPLWSSTGSVASVPNIFILSESSYCAKEIERKRKRKWPLHYIYTYIYIYILREREREYTRLLHKKSNTFCFNLHNHYLYSEQFIDDQVGARVFDLKVELQWKIII